MITFKLVAESRCDVCGEWKATDWVAADAMKLRSFWEEAGKRLAERGWKLDISMQETGPEFRIACPECAAKPDFIPGVWAQRLENRS